MISRTLARKLPDNFQCQLIAPIYICMYVEVLAQFLIPSADLRVQLFEVFALVPQLRYI